MKFGFETERVEKEKPELIEGLIRDKEDGVTLYREDKEIDNLSYSFQVEGLEDGWVFEFMADDSFSVTNKGLETAHKVMDEVARIISVVKDQESGGKPFKVILVGSIDSVLHDDIRTLRKFLREYLKKNPQGLEGFKYMRESRGDDDQPLGLVVKNGKVYNRILDVRDPIGQGTPIDVFFKNNAELSSVIRNPGLCEALCEATGISFVPTSSVDYGAGILKSEQRGMLFERSLRQRLPDATVLRMENTVVVSWPKVS